MVVVELILDRDKLFPITGSTFILRLQGRSGEKLQIIGVGRTVTQFRPGVWSSFCFRGDEIWQSERCCAHRAGHEGVDALGLGPGRAADAVVVRAPRRYRFTIPRTPTISKSCAVSCIRSPTAHRGLERHAQVQQPGSFNVRGRAHRGEPAHDPRCLVSKPRTSSTTSSSTGPLRTFVGNNRAPVPRTPIAGRNSKKPNTASSDIPRESPLGMPADQHESAPMEGRGRALSHVSRGLDVRPR